MTVQRYRQRTVGITHYPVEPHDHGPYVLFADHEAEIARVREDERGRVVSEFMSNHGDREAYTAALHDPLGCTLSYNKALRDAVEAVKALDIDGDIWLEWHGEYGLMDGAITAIEGLSTNADNSTNVHERRQAAAELTRMAQEDGLS